MGGAPAGVVAHVAVIASFALAAIFSTNDPVAPQLSRMVFHWAPPPPSPQPGGDPMALERVALPDGTVPEPRIRRVSVIPEAMLSPLFDVSFGAERGFDEAGMEGGLVTGIPGGVVGGVPGGVVGGLIGGTGTQAPRFPEPDVGPSPIRMPQPGYTKQAIRDNVSGAVRLRVVIDEKGRVEVLEVLQSIPSLDAEAIRVVESGWLFRPATRNGRPVPALSELVVRFRLY